MSQTSQSIIISGESGSGKTETSKLFMKFFCGFKPAQFGQHMIDSNILLESFGNSCTSENSNSSRFIKTILINLNPAGVASSIELKTFSLETSRVTFKSHNFHVFHYLAYGAPEDLKTELTLQHCTLFEQPTHEARQTMPDNFKKVDRIFDSLRLLENEKKTSTSTSQLLCIWEISSSKNLILELKLLT